MQSSTVFGDVGFYSLVKALVLEEFSQEWTREVVDNVTSNLSSFRQQRICNLSIAKPSPLSIVSFQSRRFQCWPKRVIIVKNKHVQTGHTCFLVVDDEDNKENLRKILQKKIGFMLKARPSTWELLLGQRRKQTGQYLRLRRKCESVVLYAYSHIGSGYNILCSLCNKQCSSKHCTNFGPIYT